MKRIKFYFYRLDTNHHDWSNGKHGETIHGPKFTIVKLETLTTKGVKALQGRRLWFYFPSGACWNFDIYLTNWPSPKEKGAEE